MTRHKAFLQAIIERPDDDSLRLIYADYLDENGNPDRAEFIRIQVALASLPESDGRRAVLKVKERNLLVKHSDRWLGPLRSRVLRGTFRRGFVEIVTVPAQVYLDHVDAVRRLAPIRQIEIDLNGAAIFQVARDYYPESLARELTALPIGLRKGRLVVVLSDTGNPHHLSVMEFILNRRIEAVSASAEQITSAIERFYGGRDEEWIIS